MLPGTNCCRRPCRRARVEDPERSRREGAMSFPKGLTFPVSIDWVPPSLNLVLRMNRFNRAGLRQLAGLHLIAAGLRKQQSPTNHRVKVTIQMYRKRPMDRDNAVGALKVLFD